jgi:uncharacterized protein YbjT (DUF2867 family)
VVADLYDPKQLLNAMKGTVRAYYCPPLQPFMIQSAAAFAVAAREAKLESIVQLSQWLSSPSHPSMMTRQTWLIDQLFSMIPGVAHTILNPGWFADNNLRVISFAALLGVFPVVTADSRNAPPSNEDIARVAAAVLMDPLEKHAGKTYRPTGPKLLSAYDMVDILSRVLERKVRALPMPLWMLYKAGLMQGAPKFQMASLRYYIEDHKQGAFELNAPTNDVLEVTGRPAEDFETTVRRYAALPEAQRTLGNTLLEFAKFMWTPLAPGLSPARYERQLDIPEPPKALLAMRNEAWLAQHRSQGIKGERVGTVRLGATTRFLLTGSLCTPLSPAGNANF